MDEATLVRDLLERAITPEPPIGPLAQNALRAGTRLRRRRRVRASAASAAAVAVICVCALVLAGTSGNPPAAPTGRPATVYVLGGDNETAGTVISISTTTHRLGKPIALATGIRSFSLDTQMAVAPDGKTIWVSDGDGVTPISTATALAGRPVRVVYQPGDGTSQVLVTPDGKTVYVLDSTDAVTPISTATHRPGKPIELGEGMGLGANDEMAITPDGRTLYVVQFGDVHAGPSYVTPIDTATNRPGKRIAVATSATSIAVAPDGKTVYVIGLKLQPPRAFPPPKDESIEVIPIATATNRPGRTITVGRGITGDGATVAMTPDGRTLYIPDITPNGLIPFSTVTNTPGKLIGFGSDIAVVAAFAPNGSIAYALSQRPNEMPINAGGRVVRCADAPGTVTPIATATNTVGKPIKVSCIPGPVAVTPDGKTLYVGSDAGTVTPFSTSTGRAGKPIKVKAPAEILIVPGPG